MTYESGWDVASETAPGIRFRLRRVSFRGRLDLLRAVRAISSRQEFAAAGDSLADRVEAAVLEQELNEIYLQWGLLGVEGLTLDGEPASIQALIERGPEPLCQEILTLIKKECGVSEDEIKN